MSIFDEGANIKKENLESVVENSSVEQFGNVNNTPNGRMKNPWIVFIGFVVVLMLLLNMCSGSETKKVDGFKVFKVDAEEFVEKYNKAYYKLSDDDYFDPSENPFLNGDKCKEYDAPSDVAEMYENVVAFYEYDTTVHDESAHGMNSVLRLYVDSDDNVVAVEIIRLKETLSTEEELEAFYEVDCAATVATVADKSLSKSKKFVKKLANGKNNNDDGIAFIDGCECLFQITNDGNMHHFVMRVEK